MFIFHEVGNLLRVAVLLVVIVVRGDIVFRDEHRHLGFVPDFFNSALERIDVQAGTATALATGLTAGNLHVMSLQAVSVNRSTSLFQLVDEVDTFVLLPLNSVIVVINEDCIRPTFTSHLECGHHEFVVAVIATESGDDVIVVTVAGVIAATRLDSFVHHVDHFEVRIMLLDSIHPVRDGRLGIGSAKAIQPVGVLGAPHESVELEVTTVLLCPVVGSVATTPVVVATGAFDRGPLTFVFGRNLVPQLRKVAADLATSCNVTDELRCTIGQAGSREGESCCCKSNSSNFRCCRDYLFHIHTSFFDGFSSQKPL